MNQKKKPGRRKLPPGKHRVKIAPSVAPETAQKLEEITLTSGLSQGAVLDRLIAKEHKRMFPAK